MPVCEEEPNRLMGFPVSRVRRYGEEPQHAMGVPLAWQEPVTAEAVLANLRAMLRHLRARRDSGHRTP